MSQTRVQTNRLTLAGSRPASSSRKQGELYLNYPDRQLGMIDSTQSPLDLLGVRFFSTGAGYSIGDYVNYNGNLYRAKAASVPGPFVPTNWSLVADADNIGPITSFTSSVAGISTRAAIASTTMPLGTYSIITSGFSTQGDGGAGVYVRLASAPGAARRWHAQSAEGTWWQLVSSAVTPRQMGAKLDGALSGTGTDDTIALQDWVDYPTQFGGVSVDQPGIAINPTTVIELKPGARIEGSGQLTILRTTNAESSIMECGTATSATQANVSVRGINLQTLAGFAASTSAPVDWAALRAAINAGPSPPTPQTITFTVPVGLGLHPGTSPTADWVEISPSTGGGANRLNIIICYVSAYSGTTMTVTVTAAGDVVGSGSYSAFNVDMYPTQDPAMVPLSDGATGIRFRLCNQVKVERVKVTGRFYYGIDVRNCSDVRIADCTVTGVVNRGIATQGYRSYAMSDIDIVNNYIDGRNYTLGYNYTFYAISTSATAGSNISYLSVVENNMLNTVGDGIVFGSNMNYVSAIGNGIAVASQANGIVVEALSPGIPQHTVISGNTVSGGNVGIYVLDSDYTNVTGNNIVLSTIGIQVTGENNSTLLCYGTAIVGNVLNGCVTAGIMLYGMSGAGAVVSTLVANNMISGTSGGDNVLLAGGSASGVMDTTITGNQSKGASAGWGFNGSNCLNTMMIGNIASGNSSGNNNVAGATIAAGTNIGF